MCMRLHYCGQIMSSDVASLVSTRDFCNSVCYIACSFSFHQRTPIHMAAKSGDRRIVKHLVDKEADIKIMDDTGVNTEFRSHKLISYFWFQCATPGFAQPAPCGFTDLHLCTCFVDIILCCLIMWNQKQEIWPQQ